MKVIISSTCSWPGRVQSGTLGAASRPSCTSARCVQKCSPRSGCCTPPARRHQIKGYRDGLNLGPGPNLRAHLVTQLHAHLLCDAGRHRHGRHPAGLRAADLHPSFGVALQEKRQVFLSLFFNEEFPQKYIYLYIFYLCTDEGRQSIRHF